MDIFSICTETMAQCQVDYSPFIEEHYVETEHLDDLLVDTYNQTCDTLGVTDKLDQLIERDRDRRLHVIESIVGDDEYHTTNSASWGPAIIGFGPVINGIKLSWKDAGISPYIGNYAEGWVITPPSADSTFESVNRRNKRVGVPFTLDTVKLKLLSPVRKQSLTYDTDLESKIVHLAEIAGWTHRKWFTYDFHQLALLLAPAIFDFEDARSFPFLYRSEGGSGGMPAYGNLMTMYSALHHYTRGKSKKAILGLMNESVAIHTAQMAPKDSFFLRASHLANLGDSGWLKFESAYRTLLEGGELSRMEANDLLATTEGSVLPPEISHYGVEINPNSFVEGSIISSLRKDGFLLTELDVKMSLDQKIREKAIMGREPIGILNKRLAEESACFKGKHLKVLSGLSEGSSHVKGRVKGLLELLPSGPDDDFIELATAYYRMRGEGNEHYSSFHYSDAIRVFKAHEIMPVIEARHNRVREDFARTETLPEKWSLEFLEENPEERARKRRIKSWIESAPLSELLYGVLPDGVGPDDARIAKLARKTIEQVNRRKDLDGSILILISGDKKLARYTAVDLRRSSNKPTKLIQIDTAFYTRLCLEAVQEQEGLRRRGLLDARGKPTIPIRTWGQEVMFHNYITKANWPLPEGIISEQTTEMRNKGCKSLFVHVEYDYPNVERGLDRIKYEARTNTVQQFSGGYLDGRTIGSVVGCWAQLPWPEISSWPDFDLSKSRRLYPARGGLRLDRVFNIDPLLPQSYRSGVDQWLDAIDKPRPFAGGRRVTVTGTLKTL